MLRSFFLCRISTKSTFNVSRSALLNSQGMANKSQTSSEQKGLHKALEGHNEVLNGCSKVLMVLSNAVFQGRLFMKPFRGFIRHLKVIIRFYELSKASNDLS